MLDQTAHKYSERLVSRVDKIYNHLKIPCNLADLPKIPAPPSLTTTKRPVVAISSPLIGEIKSIFTNSVNAET